MTDQIARVDKRQDRCKPSNKHDGYSLGPVFFSSAVQFVISSPVFSTSVSYSCWTTRPVMKAQITVSRYDAANRKPAANTHTHAHNTFSFIWQTMYSRLTL